ncbi:MAG TPA: MFS transporter [Chloroflexota bacterium]|nr:MFS transporter [Chloroflexota bacterium]
MTRRDLFLSVYLPSLLLSFASGLLIPTLPLYVRQLGASFEVASIVVAMAALGTLASDVPAGLIVARIGRRPAMILGAASLVVTALGLGVSRAIPLLVLFRFLSGVGSALWSLSRHTFLAEEVPLRERGRALATFGGVNRIGTFAGPAVGGLTAYYLGLVAPFFVYAGVAFVATVVAFLFVPESKRHAGPKDGINWRAIPRLVRQNARSLATVGLAQVFAQMIRAGRQFIIPVYGAYAVGLDVSAVGTIMSASAAVDMSLFYPAGVVMDRFGRRFAIVPSFILLALGMGLVPLTHSFLSLLVVTVLIGLGNGLGSGSMMTLGADLAPPDETGQFLGIWRLIGDAGSTGGPMVVGAVADVLGLSLAAVALSGIGLAAAILFLVFVEETLRPQHVPRPEREVIR